MPIDKKLVISYIPTQHNPVPETSLVRRTAILGRLMDVPIHRQIVAGMFRVRSNVNAQRHRIVTSPRHRTEHLRDVAL